MIYWNHKNKTQITNERNEKEMKLQVALDVGFTTDVYKRQVQVYFIFLRKRKFRCISDRDGIPKKGNENNKNGGA